MAYLKGGTVVDGNLYVEGGLRVTKITDQSGSSIPHLADEGSSVPSRLIKFNDSNAALQYTYLSVIRGDDKAEVLNAVGFGDEDVEKFALSLNGTRYLEFFGINGGSGVITNAKFNSTPDKIKVLDKNLTGLVEDEHGSIIIEGKTYEVAGNNVVPDIFYYA